jgi:hypothetical protein
MKNTLEYEILKHLYENRNLKENEVSNLHTDKEYLKKSLSNLMKDKRIKARSKSDENIIAEITPEGIEKLNKIESENNNNIKANLEIENLKLQKESAEYSKTLRKKEVEIRELTSSNLILQNKQLRRYILYSIISFISGAVLTNLKDILDLWKILIQ